MSLRIGSSLLAWYPPHITPLCIVSENLYSGESELKDGIEFCYSFFLHNIHIVAYNMKVA